MAWLSGIFTRAAGATRCADELAADDDINATPMDADFNDMAEGINTCFPADGSKPAAGNWDLNGFKIQNYGGTGYTLPVAEKGDTVPTISGDPGVFTYNEQYCEYTRHGNLISFALIIQGFYSATPSGTIKITHNIPYTPLSLNVGYPCVVHHANISTDEIIQASVNQTGGVDLWEVSANGTQTAVDGTDVNGLIVQVAVVGSFIKS